MPEWTAQEHYNFLWNGVDSTNPNSINIVREYLAAGYPPDTPDSDGKTALAIAVSSGDAEKVQVLVEAITSRYKFSDPDRFIQAMAQGRAPMNQINRGIRKLVDFIGGFNGWECAKECAQYVDDKLQGFIDTLPVEKRRLLQSQYPPLNIKDNHR